MLHQIEHATGRYAELETDYGPNADQQLGQMYELMSAIRKQELEQNDPEFDPTK